MKNLTKSQKPLNTLERQKKIERRAKRAYALFACLVLSRRPYSGGPCSGW